MKTRSYNDAARLILLASLAALLATGCRHHPVYPELGSLSVASDPPGAEVLVDGQSTRRSTPCKIDGIAVGARVVTLRLQWFRIWSQTVTIRPAETRHLSTKLAPMRWRTYEYSIGDWGDPDLWNSDCAYDSVHERLYITSGRTACLVCGIRDTLVVPLYSIELGGKQRMPAVSAVTNRLFCLTQDTVLAMVDLNAPAVVRRLVLPGMRGYTALEVSPDGNMVMAADSSNKRLVLLDARLGSVLKYVGLPAGPSDALFGRDGSEAYVTLPQRRQMARVNLASGAVTATLATGRAPNDLFWDAGQANIGWCNRADKSITIANIAAWNATTAGFSMGGSWIGNACVTSNPVYVTFIAGDPWSTGGMAIDVCYLPTWNISAIMDWDRNTGYFVKIVPSSSRRNLIVLCYGGIRLMNADI
jgi:hypothetical protein